MATIRFRELVKKSGNPETKSLWSDPKRDREFMRAAKQSRVLTVVQDKRHEDFGEVGFHQQPHATYLVFPKPLSVASGAKVVGIKYDLIRESEPSDALSPESLKALAGPKRHKHEKPVKQPRAAKAFKVRVRRVATIESVVPVEAGSKSEAKAKAIELTKGMPFNSSEAEATTEVVAVE